MHVPINVKYPKNISEWQMEFNSAFKGLSTRYSSQIFRKHEFLDRFSKNIKISNFTKIRPNGAELFHADGLTDRHDAANSHFSKFWESA
jgi:hypothetical protein